MLQTRFEASLNQVEQQVALAHAALIGGDPHEVESSTATLRQMSMELHGLVGGLRHSGSSVVAQFRSRLMVLSELMALQRDGLSRRTSTIDRALHSMLPAVHTQTYSQLSSQYGSTGRQSGAFKLLTA
jgi:hypothetical protein